MPIRCCGHLQAADKHYGSLRQGPLPYSCVSAQQCGEAPQSPSHRDVPRWDQPLLEHFSKRAARRKFKLGKRRSEVMNLSDDNCDQLPHDSCASHVCELSGHAVHALQASGKSLYCACDSKNAYMCPDLFMAAARHVQSHIQASPP